MKEQLNNLRKLNERNELLYQKKFITKEEYIRNLKTILSRIRDLKISESQNSSILDAIAIDINLDVFRLCVGNLTYTYN